MDRLIYTAYTGMRGTLAAQATIANNLANASTVGFRAERTSFTPQHIVGPTFDVRAPVSEEVVDADLAAGARIATGRPLDVALDGEAMLAVQAPGQNGEGEEAYTRRGDLMMSPSGLLQTGDGHPVLGGNGPISVPPSDRVTIAPDGTVLSVPPGGAADKPVVLDRLRLVSPRGTAIAKGLDGLFHVKHSNGETGGVLPDDPTAKLASGALEQSNVNSAAALVAMIENSRAFETRSKLLSAAKDIDEGGASLMRLS